MNNNLAKYLSLWSLAALPFTTSAANVIDPTSAQAIEKILSDVNSPDKPALAIVALKDGKVVYEKAFGSANLEYKIPATVDTRFQVDKMAWEFIAFATLTLEDQGKIGLDEDIRKYLPELPDFGAKLTVRHLLSSTDGLHSYKVLKSLGGWESREPEQYKTILQFIHKQKALNFKPGTAFSPGGDTRLVLLAKIVEAVSGQPFEVFCQDQIFTPLGMKNTTFVSDSGLPLANTAVPYRAGEKGAYRADFGSGIAGPANLYSSVRDLSLWRAHLSSQAPGVKAIASKLNTPVRLDDGTIVKDISSISNYGQHHVGQERGIPKVYMIGAYGGYASSIFSFPAQRLTVITLSSGLAYSGSYGMRLATVLLEDQFPEPASIEYDKITAVKLPVQQLQKYEGSYWNSVRALAGKVYLKGSTLYFSRAEGAEGREMIPLGDGLFQVKVEGDDKFLVRFVASEQGLELHYTMSGSDPSVYKSYKPTTYTKDEQAQFSGTYYSEELDSSFVIAPGPDTLMATNLRVGTVNLTPRSRDLFAGDRRFMAGVKFMRGKNGEVTGFQVVIDEVRNLVFKKLRTS